MDIKSKNVTVDMTDGNIFKHLLYFCVPLILGNLFQVLYNTVDSMVVGNFVGTQALAAVAATGAIVNIAVFSFNGLSIGAGVVIGQYFGAHDKLRLHTAVETTMAITFLFSAIFTVAGILGASFMLNLISTPEDVIGPAASYLKIYFAGVTGLLVYNMGSGILRAVGDSKRPLYFLMVSTALNIVLDLLFVIGFKWGIEGAALATIISQITSAFLVTLLLMRSNEVYKYVLKDTRLNQKEFKRVLKVGLPAAFQSLITTVSNTFVLSYINAYGAAVMAGWGCYTKIDQILLLSTQSMGNSASAFVSQNVGASKNDRAREGTKTAIFMIIIINLILAILLFLLARPIMGIFSSDQEVIESGITFTRTIILFYVFNGVDHTLAGALRGREDAKAPMISMLATFVALRQIYLFILTRFISSQLLVGFSYPVGWMACCLVEVLYYRKTYLK